MGLLLANGCRRRQRGWEEIYAAICLLIGSHRPATAGDIGADCGRLALHDKHRPSAKRRFEMTIIHPAAAGTQPHNIAFSIATQVGIAPPDA